MYTYSFIHSAFTFCTHLYTLLHSLCNMCRLFRLCRHHQHCHFAAGADVVAALYCHILYIVHFNFDDMLHFFSRKKQNALTIKYILQVAPGSHMASNFHSLVKHCWININCDLINSWVECKVFWKYDYNSSLRYNFHSSRNRMHNMHSMQFVCKCKST